MKITPVPAFNDNYIWVLENDDKEAYVVDPGDAVPVEAYLARQQLNLRGILITHHHADHTGGIGALCQNRNIPVYGPAGSHIKGISHSLTDASEIKVLGHKFIVISVPGHTLDHIAYFKPDDKPALFCGDTLFAGGCGRLFEGTAEMMYTSLRQIEALPADTRVYCAHEYTLSNLAFAQRADPDNRDLAERIQVETDKRRQGLPTLPSTILLERRTNPFLRCHIDSLQVNVGKNMAQSLHSEVETFAALRRWKDQG